MITGFGVDARQCSTDQIRKSLAMAENLLQQIAAGTLDADPSWDALLATDVAVYRAELAEREEPTFTVHLTGNQSGAIAIRDYRAKDEAAARRKAERWAQGSWTIRRVTRKG